MLLPRESFGMLLMDETAPVWEVSQVLRFLRDPAVRDLEEGDHGAVPAPGRDPSGGDQYSSEDW